ncbi:unnamed protein product [Candidula unifasciata]|uniref:NADH dehydrogenase [ubiquinone] 1 beta subcomplex subunit 5, mitochondrial n=1 Tax=Candidula unifasciata TaxID=100452 RepID=A0A8S3ZER6_9EUPU|nr:unnamed protein product [Candidula unifasciata]
MAAMSLLSPVLRQAFRLASYGRPVITPLNRQLQLQGHVSVRNGGHANQIPLIPSQFQWTRFKDDFHFYLLLGLVPMFSLITYANIFIGPAELSDIPEGYEPKEWEYYKSPIKRWFAKYVYNEPQKDYEKTMHYLHQQREARYWRMLEKKVRQLQSDRQDYKGWYWVPFDKSVADEGKASAEEALRFQGAR